MSSVIKEASRNKAFPHETAKDEPDKDQRPFLADVWANLSRVDVGDHIQIAEVKKDGRVVYTYSYLSWSWCWAVLMSHYPESKFKILKDERLEDGTVLVNVKVTITDSPQEVSRKMYLPVMDRSNNAIKNPNARNINDTRMRCLVKCLALFGLGLDLWAKSDIPVGTVSDPLDESQVELVKGLYDRLPKDAQESFMVWADVDDLADLPKSRYQAARQALERKIKALSE